MAGRDFAEDKVVVVYYIKHVAPLDDHPQAERQGLIVKGESAIPGFMPGEQDILRRCPEGADQAITFFVSLN